MITNEFINLIEENPLALATANKDGNPHVTNVAYAKVKGNKILITNNYMSKTIENIKSNSKVCIAVYNKNWKGYQIEGIAKYFEDGENYKFVKSMKENRSEPCKGVVVVDILNLKETG